MRTRIESEFARTAVDLGNGVNILQKLTLVLDYAGAFKAGAVLQSRNVATKQTSSASMQTTNEHISESAIIPLLKARHFSVAVLILFTA